jgi:hypothetical protein
MDSTTWPHRICWGCGREGPLISFVNLIRRGICISIDRKPIRASSPSVCSPSQTIRPTSNPVLQSRDADVSKHSITLFSLQILATDPWVGIRCMFCGELDRPNEWTNNATWKGKNPPAVIHGRRNEFARWHFYTIWSNVQKQMWKGLKYSSISVIRPCSSPTCPVIRHQASAILCWFLQAAETDLCSVELCKLICFFFNINDYIIIY